MKIVGVLMEYNESSRGNLRRCLGNMERYCDEIVVYDDASLDDSRKVALEFTDHVIVGAVNSFINETVHRSKMLKKALELGPDFVFWIDADEVLDRDGTCDGLRSLCEKGFSHKFREVTLWRSQRWQRLDYLGEGNFIRLWKNTGGLAIPHSKGLHKQLTPNGLGEVHQAPYRVLHYGYATQEAIERRWDERTKLGVSTGFRRKGINETYMKLDAVPAEWFPPGTEAPDEPMPKPIRYSDHIMHQAGLA